MSEGLQYFQDSLNVLASYIMVVLNFALTHWISTTLIWAAAIVVLVRFMGAAAAGDERLPYRVVNKGMSPPTGTLGEPEIEIHLDSPDFRAEMDKLYHDEGGG